MKKTFISIVGTIVVSAFVLTSCGSTSEAAKTEADQTADETASAADDAAQIETDAANQTAEDASSTADNPALIIDTTAQESQEEAEKAAKEAQEAQEAADKAAAEKAAKEEQEAKEAADKAAAEKAAKEAQEKKLQEIKAAQEAQAKKLQEAKEAAEKKAKEAQAAKEAADKAAAEKAAADAEKKAEADKSAAVLKKRFVKKTLPANLTVGAKGDKKAVVETDPAVVSVINEGKGKFIQSFYTDGEKEITLEYSLYIPENVDYSKKYPLVMYIPDASAASKSAKEIVEQYFGADIWVSADEQKKHECFVYVPAFSGVAVDDNYQVFKEVDVAVSILKTLVQNYNIDSSRIYATGQSMGCMTSLYLESQYPDLFAASLYVSGQWWAPNLSSLKDAKFFYITAEGDEKATSGQQDVMDLIGKSNYAYGTWSAKESADVQNANAKNLISQKKNANFIRFTKGSVLSDSTDSKTSTASTASKTSANSKNSKTSATSKNSTNSKNTANSSSNTEVKSEHNASFNYGYEIEAVRDWLFEQKSENSLLDKVIKAAN